MCPRKLVIIQPDGTSSVLEQVLADDEEQLQEQLKDQPELLPLDDLNVEGPVLVVGRETPLASGRIDLVALGRGGELLLVEFKTGPQNTDFRHALAQLLDYGSDLWGMDHEGFEAAVALRYFQSGRCPIDAPGRGARSLLEAAQQLWGDASGDVSWSQQLERALNSGTFKYVLVAQRFTPSILKTIRYLNDSHDSEFFAVEMIRFSDPNSTLGGFEARLIAAPERRRSSSSAAALAGVDALLDEVEDEDYRAALESFFEAARELDVTIYLGTTGVSLRIENPATGKLVSIGWVFPPGPPRWMGLTHVTLGFWEEDFDTRFQDALDEYVGTVNEIPGGEGPAAKAIHGKTFDPDAVSSHHTQLADSLATLMERLGG